ncbi:MAG: hypothetical protein QXO51_03945 [Halobacteria archaeon]
METNKFLGAALGVSFLLAGASLVLKSGYPTAAGPVTYYTSLLMPLLLTLSIYLSFRVSRTYERQLRKAFLFVAAYLGVLTVGNLKPLWHAIYGANPYLIPLFLDCLASSMLFFSCFYTLKVVRVRKMSDVQWLVLAGIFIGSVALVVANVQADAQVSGGRIDPRPLTFGILNFTLVNTLVPVLFLYLQQFRGEARESITFLMLVVGIIIATVADWIYAIAAGIPHNKVGEFLQSGSSFDVVLLMAYFVIFVGLFVHTNYEKWQLKRLKEFKLED